MGEMAVVLHLLIILCLVPVFGDRSLRKQWVMILSVSLVTLMKACCAVSAEMCWKIRCRLLVNMHSALPAYMDGLFITVAAQKIASPLICQSFDHFTGCPVQVERRNLNSHLAVCEYRNRECPNGCGYGILSADDAHHNCVAELRTELELLRSEMIYRMEEAKLEMESRLDSQRRHMVQKESLLQNEIKELKSQMSRMMSDIGILMTTERQHRQELEQAELEKQELLELIKSLQTDCRLSRDGNKKASNFQPLTRLESMKRKSREVTVI
ncbi:uncharacterized protein LOC123020373 isoform X2 [Varanus komodoensis]|uniref:Uncharacterized protein n=1 Tax=Varanus komodoensis TaxID=61221 RepID=A0A8D2KYW8_VARKO|nr:uncharacterized protein LOC123020373 isoform X2 [Varanus komodoensis]